MGQKRAMFMGVLAAIGVGVAGCHTSPPGAVDGGTTCASTSDCTGATVCRNGACTSAPCSLVVPCQSGEICTNNQCVPGSPKACKVDGDCVAGTGVCRAQLCTLVACAETTPCPTGELCTGGQCAPGNAVVPGVPGHSIASGGSVATSGKHIHIGLTGQGLAVGAGSSATHRHTTGATSVMQR